MAKSRAPASLQENPENSKIGRPPRQIDAVRKRIYSEYIKNGVAGTSLPSQSELAKRYKVNPKTIQAAVAEMTQSGVITRKPYGRIEVAKSIWAPWKNFEGKFVSFVAYTLLWTKDSFALSVFEGVRNRLGRTGINVAMPTRRHKMKSFGPHLPNKLFESMDIIGVILLGMNPIRNLQKPMVAVDFDAVRDGIDSFCFDNVSAGEMLVRRLYKLGHRRFATLVEHEDKPEETKDQAWLARHAGVKGALAKLDATSMVEVETGRSRSFSGELRALRQLLERPAGERITALILPSNVLDQVRTLASELRLRIPRDLSVVGYAGAGNQTELTSIRFDGFNLGHAAANHLLTHVRDAKWEERKVKLHIQKGRYVAGKTHARAPAKA